MEEKQSLLGKKIILIELHGTFYDVRNEIKECQSKYKDKIIQIRYIDKFKMPYESDNAIELRVLAELTDKVTSAQDSLDVIDVLLIINFNTFSSFVKDTNVFKKMYPVTYAIVDDGIIAPSVNKDHVLNLIINPDISEAISEILSKYFNPKELENKDAIIDKD